MKTRSFQLKQGRLTEIPTKRGGSEKRIEEASKQFGPNGEDLVFERMKRRLGPPSKRRLPQAA